MIQLGIEIGTYAVKVVVIENDEIIFQAITESAGKPYAVLNHILSEISEIIGDEALIGVTGSGANRVADIVGIKPELEDRAILETMKMLYPETRSALTMGHQTSRCIRFENTPKGLMIDNSVLSPGCASGSGTFIDYLREEMEYESMEDFVEDALTFEPADLAGRCAVFARSDMVHLRQVGGRKGEIAAGVCKAAARQLWTTVAESRCLQGPVLFIGGVSSNRAVAKFVHETIEHSDELIVPIENRIFEAIGTAKLATMEINISDLIRRLSLEAQKPFVYKSSEPLRNDMVKKLEIIESKLPKKISLAALGLDIGSVSTKAVLVANVDGVITTIAKHYGRTGGDPLLATKKTLEEINRQVKELGIVIETTVAATTGSGRYLTGKFIGANNVINEISAQGAGAASCVSSKGRFSVVEIGGQDSKYLEIEDGRVIDYTMNKACAAGCGVFLEVVAKNLGVSITELGPLALRGYNPPLVDTTCTVLTERSLQDFLLKSVTLDNLASAAVKAAIENYFKSNVASDRLLDKVVFQGAVAKNDGMTAALATALDREVIVPDEPELTGAIGAASIALRTFKDESNFRGFDNIANLAYKPSSFVCEKCNNRCTIYAVGFGSEKFYSGDKCDRFSSAGKQKTDLPDLFKEYSDLLDSCCAINSKKNAPQIGIPRALLFNEYGPLYTTFFTELGFNVEVSDKTNKRVIAKGQEACKAPGTCLPIKALQGLVESLIEQGITLLFVPQVTSGANIASYARSQTCPFVQGAPDLINASQDLASRGIKLISPTLAFQKMKTVRGRRGLKKAFEEMANDLGKSSRNGSYAFEKGMEALEKFQGLVHLRGQEILAGLDKKKTAIVVASRPYSLYDPGVSMQIGQRIQSLGILAIPQDFLPISKTEIGADWRGMFSAQLQKRVHLAEYIVNKPYLKVVLLTHFGCGPDSFGNPFFEDALGQSFCAIQVDEHTAPAGVMTRLEAFVDTIDFQMERKKAVRHYHEVNPNELVHRMILMPHPNDTSLFLTKSLSLAGVKSMALPHSDDKTMRRARRVIREDVCLPMLQVLEDILAYAERPDFNPEKVAFFMGNAQGPCRFGMYQAMIRSALDKMGHLKAELITLGIIGKSDGGLGLGFTLTAWDALLVHDLLHKMLLHTRPYEREKGATDQLFGELSKRFLDEILPKLHRKIDAHFLRNVLRNAHLAETKKFLHEAARAFENLRGVTEQKPIILLLGEFYVRLDSRNNNDVILRLEDAGFEVWQAPATEFFAYANLIGGILAKKNLADCGYDKAEWQEMMQKQINATLMKIQEKQLSHVTLPYLEGLLDAEPIRIIEQGSKFINQNFGGEAICSVGCAIEMSERDIGVAGIVMAGPQGCIPSMIVQGVSQKLKEAIGGVPIVHLYLNGYEVDEETRALDAFASRARDFYERT